MRSSKKSAPVAYAPWDIFAKQSTCVVFCPLKIGFFCLMGPAVAAVAGEQQEPDQQQYAGPCEAMEGNVGIIVLDNTDPADDHDDKPCGTAEIVFQAQEKTEPRQQ